MNYLIIGCHPYEGSFNAAAGKAIWEKINKSGERAEFIDLVSDGFNPVMTAKDLKLWRQGKFDDGLVGKYQTAIEKSDILVFVFPIWWGTMPAVLKGFCDKVLLPGFAYKYDNDGNIIGLLSSKKAYVITTMQTPVSYYNDYFKSPVTGGFIRDTLETCDIELIRHFEIDNIVSGGRDYAEEKMKQVLELFDFQ
ncbi:MAG: NAD(P)H-dependent oxidoreductase [Bacillota bacterium]|nr:NAD(P)H-dependent oxidoreductase [Bacillota bacterium]